MIDLFGLKKQTESDAPADTAPEPAPEAPRGSHRLWAFLLILDSLFVIVFGGAVAAEVYQYWKAPAALAVAARRPAREAVKTPAQPKPAEEAPVAAPAAPPKPAEAPKPAETPKAELKTTRAADSPRPPKPSLVTEAPKPHEAPKPAGPASAKHAATPPPAPAPAPSTERAKAHPVEFKLHAPSAKEVQVVGAFIVRGGRKEMNRRSDGTWALTLYLTPGRYRYFFSADKKKVLDPDNPQSERGASLLTVP